MFGMSPQFRAEETARPGHWARLIASLLTICCTLPALAQAPGPCNRVGPGAGCIDITCANDVCQFIPSCCEQVWDQQCVDMADQRCSGCQVNLQDCRMPHELGGCGDSTCCGTVCAIDPYCCEVAWDGACVIYASNCASPPPLPCGDPAAGNCKQVHGTASCNDATCCELVCGSAGTAYCCQQSWDALCVQLAQSLCASDCVGPAPNGSLDENEPCLQDQNDPGIRVSGKSGSPQVINGASATVQGELHSNGTAASTDVDVYSVDLRFADTDQDGLVKLRLSLHCGVNAFAAVVAPGTMAPGLAAAPLQLNTLACEVKQGSACLAPAIWWIVVAPGTTNAISDAALGCGSPRHKYRLTMSIDARCGTLCGASTDSCFTPHSGISCSDASCCVQVCAALPLCCDTGWDSVCVQMAADLCVLPPSPNDRCADALPAVVGSQPFSLFGAGIEATTEFGCSISATPTTSDVWFGWRPDTAGLYTVSVCGVDFDSRLGVYRGTCAGFTSIACSDNSSACDPYVSGSQALANVVCGQDYLIRIAAAGGQTGAGTLRITPALLGAACCPADLDGSRLVDFGDVALALIDFGPCGQCNADLDGTGAVDFGDVALMLLESGPCP